MAAGGQGCKRGVAHPYWNSSAGDHRLEGERRMSKLIAGFLTALCLSLPAMGQPLDCSQFRRNADGSWTPISQLTVTSSPYGGQIYVGPRVFAGPELARRLNRQ